ncbi:MAG: hypothetical protein ACK55I_49165, partial [bacterium]
RQGMPVSVVVAPPAPHPAQLLVAQPAEEEVELEVRVVVERHERVVDAGPECCESDGHERERERQSQAERQPGGGGCGAGHRSGRVAQRTAEFPPRRLTERTTA